MIHVKPASEPARFHEDVRVPGLRAVAEMVGKPPPYRRTKGPAHNQRTHTIKEVDGSTRVVAVTREEDLRPSDLPDYWTKCLDDVMRSYNEVCAYSCFRIHKVTGARSVDHFAPRSRAWDRVYEWSNYRLACSRLNARKRDFSDLLDPFEVETGWFRLELVGFQTLPAPGLDASLSFRVQETIDRLGLNDTELRSSRAKDAEYYWAGDVSLRVLREESPFVAIEVERQHRLHPRDVR